MQSYMINLFYTNFVSIILCSEKAIQEKYTLLDSTLYGEHNGANCNFVHGYLLALYTCCANYSFCCCYFESYSYSNLLAYEAETLQGHNDI